MSCPRISVNFPICTINSYYVSQEFHHASVLTGYPCVLCPHLRSRQHNHSRVRNIFANRAIFLRPASIYHSLQLGLNRKAVGKCIVQLLVVLTLAGRYAPTRAPAKPNPPPTLRSSYLVGHSKTEYLASATKSACHDLFLSRSTTFVVGTYACALVVCVVGVTSRTSDREWRERE